MPEALSHVAHLWRKSPILIRALLLISLLYYLISCRSFSLPSNLQISPSSPFTNPNNIANQPIPQKIWQTWHTPAALLASEDQDRVRTWLDQSPHHRYELITDRGAESYVRHHFADDTLIRDVFLNLTDAILRADFLRYLLLLAEGGVYADLDVECREPIDGWIPSDFQDKVGVVLGIEADRKPVENDARLYYDHRPWIWGITNWTLMAKRGHPFLRFVAESVASNLLEMARKQGKSISTMDLSYKEVIDATGPRAFTETFLAYASRITKREVTYRDATMLEQPKLIGDILLLPIRAFSASEASREDVEGAHSLEWPSLVYHWSVGTWKKTHLQKPESETLGRLRI